MFVGGGVISPPRSRLAIFGLGIERALLAVNIPNASAVSGV